MALCSITFQGERLRRENVMQVWLPDRVESQGPYPVLYLLNAGDLLMSRVERYADKLPLIIVMPDGKRGYCVDASNGPAHGGHMIHDVVGFVERFLPAVRSREARALIGQSMSGYGAVKLAMEAPEMFGSAVAQGGSFRRGGRLGFTDWPKAIAADYGRLFGLDPEGGPNDIFALAEKLDPDRAPAIRIEVGLDDVLLQHSRDLHAHLESLGIPHDYHEYPGNHSFETWDEHLHDALDFIWQTLGQTVSA